MPVKTKTSAATSAAAGEDGVREGVGARGHERAGVDAAADPARVEAQCDLGPHGHGDDHERRRAVVRQLRGEDALDGLGCGGDARPQHDDGDDDRREVLDAPIAKGVLAVGLLAGKLGAHDGDDGRRGVRQVVDGVEHDGDGVHEQAERRLEGREQDVCHDARRSRARPARRAMRRPPR
jgi:hypothetical protein